MYTSVLIHDNNLVKGVGVYKLSLRQLGGVENCIYDFFLFGGSEFNPGIIDNAVVFRTPPKPTLVIFFFNE